jgi:hypothetical protein
VNVGLDALDGALDDEFDPHGRGQVVDLIKDLTTQGRQLVGTVPRADAQVRVLRDTLEVVGTPGRKVVDDRYPVPAGQEQLDEV